MDAQHKLKSLVDQLNTVIVGKPAQVQDCVACLLAGGHLLIEDAPGVGKTTLAHALARTFGLQFSRVQFTADLMPSDLSGVSVYERGREAFVFHPGPIFAQVLLADEINRASPKTQSALLEAMEEKQVTVEGETRPLPVPFFVIATQNPHDQLGTHALPQSQLDRFLMRISLGYPDRAAERELLTGGDRRDIVDALPSLLSAPELQQLQQQVQAVHTAAPLLDYLQDLMPSDLSGVSVYERGKEAFVFHPGPIFAQVLLADEINRASPKTQSALLEAMEEKQVTIEGETRPLPAPFFVIATQNPHDQLGTHALPESQLDRFLMRLSLGYPDRAAERALLTGRDRRELVDALPSLLTLAELQQLQQQVQDIHTAAPLLDYLQDLMAATRSGRWFAQGLSPRAGLAVLRAAKAQALLSGRDYVAPDDIQTILPQTTAHRLTPVRDAGRGAIEQVRAMIEAVPLP